MSIFYSHRDRFCDLAGEARSPAASLIRMTAWRLHVLARRATGLAGAAFGLIHQGIVTAKMRRLQRELLLHGSARDELSPPHMPDRSGADQDAAKPVQRPLLLADKWDF